MCANERNGSADGWMIDLLRQEFAGRAPAVSFVTNMSKSKKIRSLLVAGDSIRQADTFRTVPFNQAKNTQENIMNNMPSKKAVIALAVGSAFIATLGAASVASAADNPFSVQPLDKGYKIAMSHDDDKGGYGDRKDNYGDKKYGEGRCGMSMADTDNDGRVSREEHARHAEKMFDKIDANKDGYIDKDEASAMKKKHRHGASHGSDRKYGSSDGDGVDVHRYREHGAGERYDRDLPHMRPMGE